MKLGGQRWRRSIAKYPSCIRRTTLIYCSNFYRKEKDSCQVKLHSLLPHLVRKPRLLLLLLWRTYHYASEAAAAGSQIHTRLKAFFCFLREPYFVGPRFSVLPTVTCFAHFTRFAHFARFAHKKKLRRSYLGDTYLFASGKNNALGWQVTQQWIFQGKKN